MADANIRAVITAKDEASGVLSRFGSGIGSTLSTIGAGVAVAGAAITAFGVASVKAFSESEDLIAQTNAVLKSTGGIAGVTAGEVDKLSKALQSTTKFSDEEVRSAENLLLTFTAIGKDIFPQATKTVLNMATALGEDTKSASIQLGKALQDPVLGITALRRVGVNFSDAQKDVIQKLVDTGKKAEAQKLILKELETEFGGSAEAAGGTFSGSLVKLKNVFNDLMETVGKGIVDQLTPFISKIAEFVASDRFQEWVRRTTEFMTTFFNVVGGIIRAAIPVIKLLFDNLVIAIQALWPSLQALWNTIQNQLWPALKNLWDNGGKVLAQGLGILLFAAVWGIINALNVLFKVVGFVADQFAIFYRGIVNTFHGISSTVSSVANTIKNSFKSAFNFVVDVYNNTLGKIHFKAPGWVPGLGGKEWGVSQLPHFAGGVDNFSGGLAVVGERGPEVVNLPRGSSVTPNNRIGTSNINISINGVFTGNAQDGRKLAQMVADHLKDIANAKNTSVAELLT